MANSFDPKDFRNALGSFATGVTIVTTRGKDGEKVGLTANSFSSVSLDPPMILWSLAKSAMSMPLFEDSDYFAVHVLDVDQLDLSNRFAARGEDKFAGLETIEGVGGVPLLTEFSARFQCRKSYAYEGGDHTIFVGEVLEFDDSGKHPLVFHAGRYAEAKTHKTLLGIPAVDDHHELNEDFLMYLLERVTPQVTQPFHQAVEQQNISVCGMHVLALLSVGDARTVKNILQLNELEQLDVVAELNKMEQAGLIRQQNSQVYIEDKGKHMIVKLLAVGKAVEADALSVLDHYEQQQFKDMLKRIIEHTDAGLPDPFVPR